MQIPVAVAVKALALTCCSVATAYVSLWVIHTNASIADALLWSVAQWIPMTSVHNTLTRAAWNRWEREENTQSAAKPHSLLNTPTVDVSLYLSSEELSKAIEYQHGNDWRRRPLLLKNLWSQEDLSSQTRRLSLRGLLQESMTIPYFTNSALPKALSPDATAPLSEILLNITKGVPHKIATQLVLERYPELLKEVAPTSILTPLFGNYFTPFSLTTTRLTTVPLFIGGHHPSSSQVVVKTELHCEPIANIAVQLEGTKVWTLIDPTQWWKLRPSLAADGRAFVYSNMESNALQQGRYETITLTTHAGDALYLPTWTWHRVDYNNGTSVSIGASLFHFRVGDFWMRNPLFAILIVPALIKEVVGWNTQ